MASRLTGLWQSVTQRLHSSQETKEVPTAPVNDLQVQVDRAHREWVSAQQYFQSVSEPELVDHAIYLLEAAERKYMYLLNQMRSVKGKGGDVSQWM